MNSSWEGLSETTFSPEKFVCGVEDQEEGIVVLRGVQATKKLETVRMRGEKVFIFLQVKEYKIFMLILF